MKENGRKGGQKRTAEKGVKENEALCHEQVTVEMFLYHKKSYHSESPFGLEMLRIFTGWPPFHILFHTAPDYK